MSANNTNGLSRKERNEQPTDLCQRDCRALTEAMTTLPDAPEVKGADGLYVVVSSSGSQYTCQVDRHGLACECADFAHREEVSACKHIRRVMYEEGFRPIPGYVNRDGLDDHLGQFTAGTPRIGVAGQVATDGGLEAERDQERAAANADRLEDCDCRQRDEDVPCWPCWKSGHETPSPDAPAEE